jgi:hypothetical protein
MATSLMKSEIAQLLAKYENLHSHADILHVLAETAKLEEATLILKERLKKDVYELFEKNDDGVMESKTGQQLLAGVSVEKLSVARTCSVFQTDAEVRFWTKAEATDEKPNKNKRKVGASMGDLGSLEEIVNVKYTYSEQTVGASSGTNSAKNFREKGVSVMEAPYKSINLIVSISRGEAGLDAHNLVDFQLLTAGCTPSEHRVSVQDVVGDEDDGSQGSEGLEEVGSDDEGMGGSDSAEEGPGDDSSAGSAEENTGSNSVADGDNNSKEEDTADYYTATVSHDALRQVVPPAALRTTVMTHIKSCLRVVPHLQLKNWLGFRTIEEQRAAEEQARLAQKRTKTSSHGSAGAARGNKGDNGKSTMKNHHSAAQEESSDRVDDDSSPGEGSEEQEGSPYERDPALGELLQFVLSLPYVDEMWGIHDLILVRPAFERGVVLSDVYDGVLPSDWRGAYIVPVRFGAGNSV